VEKKSTLAAIFKEVEHGVRNVIKSRDQNSTHLVIRVAVDSIIHLSLLYGEQPVLQFMGRLSALLNIARPAIAIGTVSLTEQRIIDKLNSLSAGMLEMKLEEKDGLMERSIRLLSIKGFSHKPIWVNFTITDSGEVMFGEQLSSAVTLHCTLCGKPILGTPLTELDFVFDTKVCLETYKKLNSVLGTRIADTGLPSQAINVAFFYVDIVGSSDPSLSVKRQVAKIETLNQFIGKTNAFKNAPKGKLIILPTGDGMAIGFLLNPELPLELAIELHKLLRYYNAGRPSDDRLGVRIGLASGPVFTVTDMNNVQNVWGPGIILARRVMDAGDDGHILLADKLAEDLIALKDHYRSIIKPVSQEFEIKHKQKIKLYSAYSEEFGNPEIPSRIMHA
jgi:class 3 adenylate cyclase